MNCGLSNLGTLKALVLPQALRGRTEWDVQLAGIGLGVLAAMEQVCNRRFGWVEDGTYEATADRNYVVLPRAPVAGISAIEMRSTALGAWASLGAPDDILMTFSAESGVADFGAVLGTYTQRIRVTYSGGYFFEPLESDDAEFPTDVPDGSTAVPDDLLRAWVQMVQAEIEATDMLRTQAAKSAIEPDAKDVARRSAAGMREAAMETLKPFIRYA